MSDSVEVNWLDSLAFEAGVDNHKIVFDASESAGGTNRGPRPKAVTLATLGGCSGMDVISILAKMHIVPEKFWMIISGDPSEEHPKVYHTINIVYHFKGKELPMDKLGKAVNLSQEKYCAVSAMLGKTAKIITSIEVEE
jgi:putative redox protein